MKDMFFPRSTFGFLIAIGSQLAWFALATHNRPQDAHTKILSYTAAALSDEVHHLPGADKPLPSRQFSGHLPAGEGDMLHYWFVESEHEPVTDPVALWLNGGPGASSIMGYLTEFGPYVISANGGIHYNPYNWAKHTNILFLEAPAGVGFSYCKGNISATCHADDDSTAAGNLLALRAFFNRFPGFHGKSLMVWGESYAGVYVPTLAQSIASAKPPLPVRFLGFAVGNPCTADRYQLDYRRGAFMDLTPTYALHHGLINGQLFNELTLPECRNREAGNMDELSNAHCKTAWRTFDLLTSNLRGKHPSQMPGLGDGAGFLDGYDTGAFVGSMQPYWDAVGSYLSRGDVRKALHVHEFPGWTLFATRLVYNKQYWACRDGSSSQNTAPQHKASMLPIYADLTRSGYSVLLYSGDDDPSVQWRGSELCVRGAGIPAALGRSWRPWFYVEEPSSLELLAIKAPEWGPTLSAAPRRGDRAVLGGYIEEFEDNGTLAFATVRGVGHMVPQFRPQPSLHLFERTMQAASKRRGSSPNLSPPLPVFDGMSDSVFYGNGLQPGVLGNWLSEAQDFAKNKWQDKSLASSLQSKQQATGPFSNFGLFLLTGTTFLFISFGAIRWHALCRSHCMTDDASLKHKFLDPANLRSTA